MGSLARDTRKLLKKYLFDGEVLKLMSLTIVSKPIGLATQMLLASSFGAGFAYDAYILSFFLVNFLSNTLSRVFAAVAIPYLTKANRTLDAKSLNSFTNAILGVFLVPMVIFACFVIWRPDALVNLGAPSAPLQTKQLTAAMLRLMAVPAVFMLAVELLKSILNLNSNFRVPTSMPIVNSVTTFVVLLLGHQRWGIWAMPVAFAVSYGLQLTIMLVFVARARISILARPSADGNMLLEMWSQSWMVLVSTVILVFNLFVDKIFASGMEQGSVSSIAYSRALEGFGMQVFSFSLVSVMFVTTAKFISDREFGCCNQYVETNIARLIRLAVPVCIGVVVASHEIVHVLYERNAFTGTDTIRTAGVLSMYMLGLPAFLTNMVVANVFHGLGKYRDKIWLAVQFVVTNIAGNWLLMGPLKVMGLAVSSSVAVNVHLFLSLWLLERYQVGIMGGRYARVILVNYLFGAIAWGLYHTTWRLGVLPAMSESSTRLGVVGIGALKFFFVLGLYGGVLVVRKYLARFVWGRAQS